MKGQIEITNDVQLVTKGQKVGASEAALLGKLGLKPFFYGMDVVSVYDDGAAFAADVLDIDQADVASAFFAGLMQVAALSMAVNYPTVAAVPHSVMNGYKKCISLALAVEGYEWENLTYVKEVLKNPAAFASAG